MSTISNNKKMVLASSNLGKLRELKDLLDQYGWDVCPQSEYQVSDADETGLSFVENAIIKARHACEATGLPAIADDSGIEVDALQGAPGIYSARFSGENANDQNNNERLLEKLQGVPEAERTARYQCVLVMMQHAADPTPIIAQGSWEGRILESPRGTSGFGYDPLFWVPSHKCASAELTKEVKNGISHRALALKDLVRQIA